MVRALPNEEGQVIVEAALLLPMWIGCLLGLLQLVLLQEARILTEYAAWQSARTGIVRNGDPVPMRDAAHFVLSPTACPSRSASGLLCRGGKGWSRVGAGIAVLEGDGLPTVHVQRDALSVETDFDRVVRGEADRRQGLLSFELVYWFELKIPFADAWIWKAWRSVTDQVDREGFAQAEQEAARGRYFVPIASRQVMRMQSNLWPFPMGGRP